MLEEAEMNPGFDHLEEDEEDQADATAATASQKQSARSVKKIHRNRIAKISHRAKRHV